MKIHYKKDLDSPDKIISDVIYMGIVDGNEPAAVVLKNGRELTIRLDRIEAIIDDSVFDNTIGAARMRAGEVKQDG